MILSGQISSLPVSISVTTTSTQAVLRYTPPAGQACSLKVADMDRGIVIVSAVQASGIVTVTTRSGHGLLPGATIYLENTGVSGWDGWQTIASVPTPTSFTLANVTSGSAGAGNVGVLVDDVNPALFPGADQDSRPGNLGSRSGTVFVIGHREADIAADGNRYSRALQANARHHFTLACGSQTVDQEFHTSNVPLGDTHNEGLPVDRNHPGQYSYPTVQWGNAKQALIDPLTGVRSFRATSPAGTPSSTQTFQTAIDSSGSWQSPTGPLNLSGSATFTGPCNSGNCALFLRADNLSIFGGATYTTGYGTGSSLDWVTVAIANASINNASCQGDDCKIVACLTVNGVSCSTQTREVSLTASPATYTLGTQSLMDLWQGSGPPTIARPDVSQATGTVNYSAATKQATLASGNPFSIKWMAGSRITIASAEYVIASVQNETKLTLVSGPSSDLTGAAYKANNFGVLIWKKTPRADQVTVGYTTFQYGSSPNPAWNSVSEKSCGPAVVVNGVSGFDCFVDRELYWVAQDGSDLRDLGYVAFTFWPDGRWSPSWPCGQGGAPSQFDPANGDTWYCLQGVYFDPNHQSIIQATYKGDHSNYTPGKTLPDCSLNGGVQPCVQFTMMEPNAQDAVNITGPAFNPDFAASGYQGPTWLFGGVSPEGDILIFLLQGSIDTKGWMFVFTLGDRTPAGTTPNSIRPIAAASSYRKPALSWCALHATYVPQGGWLGTVCNDLNHAGSQYSYVMTLTSASLNATPGAAGGLNTCPANPLGVTGQVCTNITVSGEPQMVGDGSFLQPTQIGDLILVDNEYLRIVAKNSSTNLIVQRGYLNVPASHSGTTLTMTCGARNQYGAAIGLWNYRADPYGANAGGTTVVYDQTGNNAHEGSGSGVFINGGTGWYEVGESLCPSALLTKGAACYLVRTATLGTLATAPVQTEALDAPFAGKVGFGMPNNVDSHPGPCIGLWCLDARPMDGGLTSTIVPQTVGSNTSPWTNVAGQLWKAAGAQNVLNRKFLNTMAYVGRSPLVDVSGPGSSIGSGAADSYKYCYALTAGECAPGSAAGDIFVNAPYVSVPYCSYPGIAIQGDDTNAICIADLGANTGNLVQVGVAQQDLLGALSRRLTTGFSRWNQHSVFWNAQATPNGQLMFSQARWLDGVRHEDLITILPPYPNLDTVSRNGFIPLIMTATPPRGLNVDNAIVEFGYAENGPSGSFYCTSRQETCVARAAAVNSATPFYYEQTEQYAGQPCSTKCTIAIPALPQHVLYYRWKYRDAAGNVLATSQTQAIPTM